MEQYLREELDQVTIHTGDIIIDHLTGYVGVIMNRIRRVDMIIDDVYFWEIKWTSNFAGKEERQRSRTQQECIDISGYLEEDTLKLSILIGAVELYSTNNDDE
tara:strand:+ start:1089 stop:1397 length:309 start_codon:yes stop_codon:yes gene_type:complete